MIYSDDDVTPMTVQMVKKRRTEIERRQKANWGWWRWGGVGRGGGGYMDADDVNVDNEADDRYLIN